MIKTSRIDVESLICGNGPKPIAGSKPGARVVSAPNGRLPTGLVRSMAVGIGVSKGREPLAGIVPGMRLSGGELPCIGGVSSTPVATRSIVCELSGAAGVIGGLGPSDAGGAVIFGAAGWLVVCL